MVVEAVFLLVAPLVDSVFQGRETSDHLGDAGD